MNTQDLIYVAGHRGMVGSAICRKLRSLGFANILTVSHKELDLCRQVDVENFFSKYKPDYVFLGAAKVGGIYANCHSPADFMYENMMVQMNVIKSAFENHCKKLLFLGSSCIYPKFAKQPIKESALLTGELEPTNEAYALAKISGLKYCQYMNNQFGTDYISVMPTNLYGPNDNYHPLNSHVLPSLLRKFDEAKKTNSAEVICWGTGSPLREFLHVDDLADAVVFLMMNYSGDETVNIGSGDEVSIAQLVEIISDVVGYQGKIRWDNTKPDGTPRKRLDISKLTDLGWKRKIPLREGIEQTYQDYLSSPHRVER